MPPPLKAWTPAEAQAEGCGSITNFFRPPPPVPRGPGRTSLGLQSLISKQPSVLNLGALPALAAPASATPATPVPDPLALPNATVVAVDGKLTEPVSLLPSC